MVLHYAQTLAGYTSTAAIPARRGRLDPRLNGQIRRTLLPEYPDITLYIEHLRSRISNEPLEEVRLASPFFLRSVDVPIGATRGKRVIELRRLGKRIVFVLEADLFLVLHLMIAGRLRWRPRGTKPVGKIALATFAFPKGTLLVTEASSKKRASLHVVRGEDGLGAHDLGGLEVLDADLERFRDALVRESHTVKRALTDPRLFSGIGNAYSDEILHAARLSPVKLTRSFTEEEVQRLFDATRRTLLEWAERLRREAGERFPEKVTAFHKAWRSTGGTENRARLAGRRSRGLPTQTTRRTTARAARPVGGSSPTAHCHA